MPASRPTSVEAGQTFRTIAKVAAHPPSKWNTYIVNENCIKCKYTDCVEVCPVDCFYEGENMLIIHPDECIDCGAIAEIKKLMVKRRI